MTLDLATVRNIGIADHIDAAKGEGTAVTTKDNVHRMADANKAFAHFAW